MVMETITYKHVNGLEIRADVYPSSSRTPAPVLVWIHGGALIMGNRRWMHRPLRELFSEAGYAQVSIDYRLAPETKLPAIVEDVCDAFRWVRAAGKDQYGMDPDRTAVVGHSGGGYLALMAGVHVRPRPRVIASFYGYGDIVGPWYSAPDPFYCKSPAVTKDAAYAGVAGQVISEDHGDEGREKFYLYCRQNGRWPVEVSGLDPHSRPEAFGPYCPVRNVAKDFPPTILLHGTDDTDVPYQLSVDMASALKAAGVEHEFVTIPNGPHGFDAAATTESVHSHNPPPEAMAVIQAARFIIEHNTAP
jgi:acetyl esterase/lipase